MRRAFVRGGATNTQGVCKGEGPLIRRAFVRGRGH